MSIGSTSSVRILFVDDEPSILNSLRRVLSKFHADCQFVSQGHQALELMAEEPFDLIVSDMRMPDMDGLELLSQVAELYPETVRIVLTGYSDEETVLKAINHGRVWGFVHKPWQQNDLLTTIQQALTTQQLMAERALLRRTVASYAKDHKDVFMGFKGNSMPMQLVYNTIERCAGSDASVFITGPSGSGKEVAAMALHQLSKRQDNAFVALNCAAIPRDLIESEIFGHIKGAFSGAVSNRNGAATKAHGGTLFLDEVGELDIDLQSKLLRFIQTGVIQKVGSDKLETVDIRFICATNRNPLEAIAAHQLREDLYYRLNVIALAMPPLCERGRDATLLAQHFLDHYSSKESKGFVGFSKNAERLLEAYSWPGNVRQLQNCIHNTVIMSEGPLVTDVTLAASLQLDGPTLAELLSAPIDEPIMAQLSAEATPLSASAHLAAQPPEAKTIAVTETMQSTPVTGLESSLDDPHTVGTATIYPLSDIERITIERAITLCNGNVVHAAQALEVSPSTLYRKIKDWA